MTFEGVQLQGAMNIMEKFNVCNEPNVNTSKFNQLPSIGPYLPEDSAHYHQS